MFSGINRAAAAAACSTYCFSVNRRMMPIALRRTKLAMM